MAQRLVLFLALVLASVPVTSVHPLSGFSIAVAQADDDDDDGGDDDDDVDDDDDRRGGYRGSRDDDDDDDRPAAVRSPPRATSVPRPRRVVAPPPEFVVTLPDPSLLPRIEALGYTVLESRRIDLVRADVARLRPPAGVGIQAARQQIANLSPDAILDVNALYRPDAFTCKDGHCAAFDMIGWAPKACLQAASEVTKGRARAPVIGIVDTTVNAEHPSLSAGTVERLSAIGSGRKPAATVHGTAVALLISGALQSRTPGLLPEARLVAAEAFHRTASGDDAADVFDVVRALDMLVAKDVDVINMSFTGGANVLLERALLAVLERGIPVAAAVGNAGPFADPLYPAAYPGAVAVTAVDTKGRVFRQAVQGAHVDLAAPGVQLWTAASTSGGRPRSGTSYAVPFVSVALALERIARPGATPADLQATLEARASDLGAAGRDSVFGVGLVRFRDCAG